MAQKSQTGGTEKNGSSLLYSKSDLKEGALQWVPEPRQGQVLLVLSMDNTCPSSSFDMDLCADKLQSLGIQAGLRHRLNKLWVVMDVAAQPELEEEAPCEESPLLSRGVTLNKDPVTCSELLHLIPEGPPQAMAQQLLVMFSACYVRLLVTGRLPRASPGGHLGHSSVPCLCQFIQSTLLCS